MHRGGPKSSRKGGKMAREVNLDFSKLKGLVRERGETLLSIEKKTGINRNTISQKWNGKGYFNSAEIFALKVLLDIDNVTPYFFEQKL